MKTTIAEEELLTCARPGCTNTVPRAKMGRRRIFCSNDCCRAAHNGHFHVEVGHEPVPEGERPTGRIFFVRLSRGKHLVVVSSELSKPSADHLARQIEELICSHRRAKGGAVE